jgi:hypothetical protein
MVITECKSVQWILTNWKMKSVNCWFAPLKHESIMCRIATQAPQWTQTFNGLKACKLANPGVLLQLCSSLTAAMSPTSVWTTPVLQMQQVKSLNYTPRFKQGHPHFIRSPRSSPVKSILRLFQQGMSLVGLMGIWVQSQSKITNWVTMYDGVVCSPTCKQTHVHAICTDMFYVVPVTNLLVCFEHSAQNICKVCITYMCL